MDDSRVLGRLDMVTALPSTFVPAELGGGTRLRSGFSIVRLEHTETLARLVSGEQRGDLGREM